MFPTEPVPDRIGAYKVIRRLSGGGAADVYLGRMEGPMGFQRTCALKLVANTAEGDARFAEELAREASICARLNHPVVVRMFDFFEYQNRLVLVLEHVEGTDLDRVLQQLSRRKQQLSDGAIWYLGHQVVGALAHAHAATDEQGSRAPVIHRNLSPENVLIAWDGQVRLTGFGLGKILGRSPDTVVGTVKGTPGHMSPEQIRGEPVTPKADVYGFGLFMWSLLTNRRPPIDGTRPEDITKIRQDIPREIAAAIQAALEPSPDKRTISCHDMEQWLAKITRTEAGKEELREKVLLLRSARSAATEHEPVRSRAVVPPRRRATLLGIRPASRPGEGGPPTPRSTGPEPAGTTPIPSALAEDRDQPPHQAASDSEPSEETASSGVRGRTAANSDSSLPVDTVRSPDEAGGQPTAEALRSPVLGLPEPTTAETTQVSARPGPFRSQVSFGTPPPVPAAGVPPGVTPGSPAVTAPASPATATPVGPAVTPATATPVGPVVAPATATPVGPAVAQPVFFSDPRPAGEFTPLPQGSQQIPGFGPVAPGWPGYEGGPLPGPGLGQAAPLPPAGIPMGMAGPPPPGYGPMPGYGPAPYPPQDAAPRTLSLLASIGLASGTAAVVIFIGVFIAIRPNSGDSTASSAFPPHARVESIAQKPPNLTPLPPLPPLSATAVAPAQPPAPANALPPAGYGHLTVKFPVEGDVYVSGKWLGPVNQTLQVRCGRWFVRIGTHKSGQYPDWLSVGRTVSVPCRDGTQVSMVPRR